MMKKALFLALSLSLGLTGFSSAALAQSTITTPVVTTATLGDPGLVLSQKQLEGVQAILASYHDIDASMSDAVYLANTGSFGTAFQGINTFTGITTGVDTNDVDVKINPDLNDVDLTVQSGSLQDARTLFNRFGTTTTELSNLLMNTGYLTMASNGTVNIDSERLANNIRWRIWADQGLQNLQNIDLKGQDIPYTSVSNNQLMRLGNRNLKLSAGSFNPAVSLGNPLSVFTTRANVIGMDRDVIMTGTKSGLNGPEVDLILQQQGPGPNQTAYRVSDMLADGSKRIVTQVISNLVGGSQIEILEERLINPQGVGIGTGVIQLNENISGIKTPVTLGNLRTMVHTDGTLVSHLDLTAGPELILHENNRGIANVAVLGTEPVPVWNTLSLPAFIGRLNRIDDWVEDLIDTDDID